MIGPEPKDKSLMSTRAALVTLFAALAGIGAGLLTLASDRGAADSILAGCGVAGAALALFNQVISDD
ncbi:hypothetical protein [Actinomadura sp. 21ATH]|uniref:hypothetical protein n=1 Tax=Actinomadura sp. 21ATH TaxID=1735444 RepID=UPI0035C24BA6